MRLKKDGVSKWCWQVSPVTNYSTGRPYHQDYYPAESPRFRRKPSYRSIKHYFVNTVQWTPKSSPSTLLLSISEMQLDPRETSGMRPFKARGKHQCRALPWGDTMLTLIVLDSPRVQTAESPSVLSLCAQKLWSLPLDSQAVRQSLPTFMYCTVSWMPALNWINIFLLLKTRGIW